MKIDYRYLSDEDFVQLYQTSLEAFSDYLVPVNLTQLQFKNHLAQNAVDLTRSVGAFFEEKLVGYTLNGFGLWEGKKTAYDAGTGVIPEFRKKGIGRAMFDFFLPHLRQHGIEQILLEVIEGNERAIRLYRKLGFEISRKLLFFEANRKIDLPLRKDFEVREIQNPDWNLLKTFWDGKTSWQFSPDSVERKLLPKMILGAHFDGKCVGYGVLYQLSGVVAQFAVDKRFRGKGVASTLLIAMQNRTENDKTLRFGNVDSRLTGLCEFFKNLGLNQTMSQFEMIKTI
ncbi:MAG: GNAT family N-acetyltransferase [Pyrinomonadaceae bacterium]